MVDPDDVAEAAARLITLPESALAPGHRRWQLTGPRAVAFAEIADAKRAEEAQSQAQVQQAIEEAKRIEHGGVSTPPQALNPGVPTSPVEELIAGTGSAEDLIGDTGLVEDQPGFVAPQRAAEPHE